MGKPAFTLCDDDGLFQVLVALHDLGVVWGDVKPDNYVFRGDRLVAVDFGSACVEAGSIAQRELGAAADTSFTSSRSDQFAWSVQYGAPERARADRRGVPCVARRSQVKRTENIRNCCGTRLTLNFSRDSSTAAPSEMRRTFDTLSSPAPSGDSLSLFGMLRRYPTVGFATSHV